MKKLNTHGIYVFSSRINPLLKLEHKEGMRVRDIFISVVRAELALRAQLEPQSGYFSPSLKRSAGALMRAIYDLGFDSSEAFQTDLDIEVSSYGISSLVQRATEFETVLANELPGLATYLVSAKGIYSTDELISHAENHVLEKLRPALNKKAEEDIQQGGKCLAFEVSTASGFHMFRAIESVMDSYYEAITGNTFAAAKVAQNWGQYIKALEQVGAESKITVFLDHIRREYRNRIDHPEDTLDLDGAFSLFGAAMSVIGQMLKAIMELQDERRLKEEAAAKTTLEKLKAIEGKAAAAAASAAVVAPPPISVSTLLKPETE